MLLRFGRQKRAAWGRRIRPLAITEQGVAMGSSVLRSERAGAVNVEIMRAFLELGRAASFIIRGDREAPRRARVRDQDQAKAGPACVDVGEAPQLRDLSRACG